MENATQACKKMEKQEQNELPSLEEIKERNEQTQRQSNETLNIGRETIQALSEQNETLENIESLTDYQSYILEKGDRTLRVSLHVWFCRLCVEFFLGYDMVRMVV